MLGSLTFTEPGKKAEDLALGVLGKPLEERIKIYASELALARKRGDESAVLGRTRLIHKLLDQAATGKFFRGLGDEQVAELAQALRAASFAVPVSAAYAQWFRTLPTGEPIELPRLVHCFACGASLSTDTEGKCGKCRWITCTCGACGCTWQPTM